MAKQLSQIVDIVAYLITIALFLQMILSFVVAPWHPARRFLDRLLEPILRPIRNLIPPVGGTLDLSPMVAWILIQILAQILKYMIYAAF